MSTARQAEANRRNASKSTGPKTEAGKARARQNSYQHGLTGQGIVTLPEVDAAVAARHAAWFPDVDDPDWFTVQKVVASLRVDRSQAEESKRRAELIATACDAGPAWGRNRDREAIALAASLARKPELIHSKLKAIPEGRAWMIRQWRSLIGFVPTDSRGVWNDIQCSLAMDLLGLATECRPSFELRDKFQRVELAKTLAESEIAALAAIDAETTELDAHRRANAKLGLGLDDDPQLKKLRRYEIAAMRTFLQAEAVLQTQTAATPPSQPQAESPSPTQNEPKSTPAPQAPAPKPATVRMDEAHPAIVGTGNRRARKAHAAQVRKAEKQASDT